MIMERLSEGEECRSLKLERRLMKLPCDVGDTVWIIVKDRIQDMTKSADQQQEMFERVLESTIEQILISRNRISFYCKNEIAIYSFCNKDFGKTVFLTREEAEKAIKKSVI